MKVKVKPDPTVLKAAGQNVAQEVLEHAKREIIAHGENGITLAGVEIVIDRLIEEYGE